MRPPIGPRVTLRMPPEELAEVDRRAKALGMKRAAYLRFVISTHLTLLSRESLEAAEQEAGAG